VTVESDEAEPNEEEIELDNGSERLDSCHRSRKFIHRKDLKEATKEANRLEKERRKRLEEMQKEYNNIEVDAEDDASGELQISLRKDSMLYIICCYSIVYTYRISKPR
jgi:hypothetical protein